jgi:hypothetical protein
MVAAALINRIPYQSARSNDGVSREGTLSTQVLLPGQAKERSDV